MPIKQCPECNGNGKVGDRLCARCHGTCVVNAPEVTKDTDMPEFLKDLFKGGST